MYPGMVSVLGRMRATHS
jgi:hypothetical protein